MLYEKDGFISTDVFSTYRDGTPIGEPAMIVIDSETRDTFSQLIFYENVIKY